MIRKIWFLLSLVLMLTFFFAAVQPVAAGDGGTSGEKRESKAFKGKKPSNPWGLPCKTYYVMQSGDTWFEIAEKYDTSALILLRLNQIKDPTTVRAGTILCVRIPRSVGYLHVVATNERLADIAARYNAKVDLILRANKLKDENAIRSAMVLYIPKSSKYIK